MMSKKDFVALADAVRESLEPGGSSMVYNGEVVDALVSFCRAQNPRFDEAKWRGYLAGTNGAGRAGESPW